MMSVPYPSTLIRRLCSCVLEAFTQAIEDHFAQMGGELQESENLHSATPVLSLVTEVQEDARPSPLASDRDH